MAFPQKRVLFFLFAVLVLGASPAFSVPLSSGIENPGAASYGTSGYTDPDGGTTLPVDGTADRASSEARIVDHQVATSSLSDRTEADSHTTIGMNGQADMGHATPGWIVPAAAVGAGGGALFAVLSHDRGGDANSRGADALGPGGSGSGGGI